LAQHHVNKWVVLMLVCMAQFMVVLDATVVNVALPSIQRVLHFSTTDLQWIVNAYALTFGGFLLLGGRAGDFFGRQRVFLLGLAIFTAASMFNGVAQSPPMLIVGRGVQGLDSAALVLGQVDS
jgi:MFS family permease